MRLSARDHYFPSFLKLENVDPFTTARFIFDDGWLMCIFFAFSLSLVHNKPPWRRLAYGWHDHQPGHHHHRPCWWWWNVIIAWQRQHYNGNQHQPQVVAAQHAISVATRFLVPSRTWILARLDMWIMVKRHWHRPLPRCCPKRDGPKR